MTTQIQKTIYETGRNAAVNLPQKWRWFDAPVTVQAETLRLFVDRKQPSEAIDKLLTALLALRREGTWECSYYKAQTLTVIAEYSQGLPTPPNFSAIAQLDGKKLLAHSFEGYKKPRV